jgi:hypothetical protein
MKKSIYLLICSGILFASCKSHKPPEIPYKQVPNATATLMWKKYNSLPPTADTNYREVPRMYGFDEETLESITANSDSGKVTAVNFMIAAYLDERPEYLKNTVLMQIAREKDKKTDYYFYDLRQPTEAMAKVGGGLPVCPPPKDCIPPGISQ